MSNKIISFKLLKYSSLIFTALASSQIFADAYQLFTNIAYDNPSTLNTVKKMDFIFGDTYLNGRFRFNGQNGPFVGSATSREDNFIPYGRFAARLNSKLVFGIDVTSYGLANIQYPIGSILQSLSTATIIDSYDISPRLSYQLTPKLAVGAAFLADHDYDVNLNFVIPPYELKNHASDWAFGWALGLAYTINASNFINVSYTSKLNHRATGMSEWGPYLNTNLSINEPIPAVFSANYTHFFKSKLLVSATVKYIQWDILQNLIITNTAFNNNTFNFPLDYKNSWQTQIAGHYQFDDKWGIGGAVVYESSAQDIIYRPVGLPTYSVWIFGLGPDYAINKNLTLKLLVGKAFSNPSINTIGPIGPVIGKMKIDGTLLDLSLSYRL